MKPVFSFLIFLTIITNSSSAQCLNDFSLGNDTSICSNESFNLTIANIYEDYFWQNTSTTNSYLVTSPGTYYCITSLANNNNLVNNGNFELGNSGFTTDYTYYPIADVFGPQASYGVINNPNTWFNPFNACADHTSGFGQMMVIDGSAFNGGNDAIWCQNIPVQAGSNYKFTYWIQSVTSSNILANIQLRINGLIVDTELAPLGACNWQEREFVWTSTTTGNVDFCLYDLELAGNGNDFALDDISIFEVCQYSDTIVVGLTPPDTISNLIQICPGDSSFVGGAWQMLPGFYFDVVAGPNCDEILRTEIVLNSIDTTFANEFICPSDSIFLAGAWQNTPGFYYDFIAGSSCNDVLQTELLWNTIDTTLLTEEICATDSIFLGGAWQGNAGIYYDVVSGNPCDEIIATTLIVKPVPNANAGGDLTVSYEQIVSLTADNTNSGETFVWTSSNNFMSTNESIQVEVLSPVQTYVLQVDLNACTNFDTVTIFGLPLNLDVRIPNAFTPNGDGVNDVFRLVNSDEFEGLVLKIYNRWGELIFLEEGGNPAWLGNYNNKKCPTGTYAFYIEATPFGGLDKMNRSGNVTLIR